MYCRHCGTKNATTARFCSQCSSPIGLEEPKNYEVYSAYDSDSLTVGKTKIGKVKPDIIYVQEKPKRGCFSGCLTVIGAGFLIILLLSLIMGSEGTPPNEEIIALPAQPVTYEKLSREISSLTGVRVKVRGKVTSEDSSFSENTFKYTLDMDFENEDLFSMDRKFVIVELYIGDNRPRPLVGDIVTLSGTVNGLESYHYLLGGEVSHPLLKEGNLE